MNNQEILYSVARLIGRCSSLEEKLNDERAKNATLSDKLFAATMCNAANAETDPTRERVIDEARRLYFEFKVKAYFTSKLPGETFPEWLHRISWNVPDFMSKEYLLDYFGDLIDELWESELDKENGKNESEGEDA